MKKIKNKNLSGTLWMLGTVVCFCLMGISIRQLSYNYSSFEIQNFRNIFCIIIILMLVFLNKNTSIATNQIKNNFIRNFFHFIGQSSWTYGITVLPLATVFSIEFTMPIWATIIAILIFKDKLTFSKLVLLILGLTGTWIILVPDINEINNNCLIVLLSAIAYAFAHNYTKILTETDSTLSILFWMSLIQLPFTIIGSLIIGEISYNISEHIIFILLLAFTSLGAHLCLTNALRNSQPSIVLPIDYLRLPIIYIIGWFLYNESLSANIIIGSLLIVTGTYITIKKDIKNQGLIKRP